VRFTKQVAAGVALSASLALVAVPAAAAATCAPEPTSQPFAHVGDDNEYFLVPGGDFEGTASWTAAGNAAIVDGGDNGIDAGAKVAKLPQNASVTSESVCFDAARPHLRFVSRAVSSGGTMRIDAIDDSGTKTLLGKFDATDYPRWQATPFVPLAGPLGVTGDASKRAKLRITALNGEWLVDAVYVDPYFRG